MEKGNNSNLVPLDFNSLCRLQGNKLTLSDYYIDYAFYSEGTKPEHGIEVVFYDKYWATNPDEIVCLDAVLEFNVNESEPWTAKVKDKIYTRDNISKRRYFCSFVGASTFVMDNGKKSENQKLGSDPTKDILGGTNSFAFAPGSELPDFCQIIGLEVNEIPNFFKFTNINTKLPLLQDGHYSDSTLIVRGGGNKTELSFKNPQDR